MALRLNHFCYASKFRIVIEKQKHDFLLLFNALRCRSCTELFHLNHTNPVENPGNDITRGRCILILKYV